MLMRQSEDALGDAYRCFDSATVIGLRGVECDTRANWPTGFSAGGNDFLFLLPSVSGGGPQISTPPRRQNDAV